MNIVNVSTIYGNTTGMSVTTTPTAIVTNATSSGAVYKINSLVVSNISGTGTASVTVDVYQNKFRIFEGSANARGVYINLANSPTAVGGEISYMASGFVNAGSFVSLDNIKATVTSSGSRGLSLASVSGSFNAMISGTFGYTNGGGGQSTSGGSTYTYTTTPSGSLFGWGFPNAGDGSTYIINDTTNTRVYRVTLMIGPSYNNNFICIERLY